MLHFEDQAMLKKGLHFFILIFLEGERVGDRIFLKMCDMNKTFK